MPAVSEAGLPVATTYEAARTALAKAEKIDDCVKWANKAHALAIYARQANDDSLAVMARRIQARASRRGGELLKLIEPGKTGPKLHDGGGIELSRTQAATDAGLSERQKVTMLRVASVPQAEFDAKVENPKPPTITRLAEAGTKKRPRADDAEAREIAMAIEAIRTFAKFCQTNDPRRLLPARSPRARADLKRDYHAIVHWLDSFADYHNAPVEGSDEADLGEP